MVSIVGGVFLFFALTGIVSTKSAKSILLKEKYNTIKAISEQSASKLAAGLKQTETLLSTEKFELEHIHQYPRLERRPIIIGKLTKLLESNPDLTSIWADWERLAVDSLDSKMLNTPGATGSGKFCATVFRSDSGIELANYNQDDDEEGDYYNIPKSTKQLYIADPYFENYESSTNYLIITMSLPIIVKNEVIGVVGADINISQINRNIIEQLKEQNGRFFIIGPDQMLLIYDKEEAIGKETESVLANEKSKNEELISAIKNRASGFYDYIDSDGTEYLAYVSLTNILKKDEVSVLLIPSTFFTIATMKVFIIAFVILFSFGLLIFYILTSYILKKIVGPVNKVSQELKKLGEGNSANVSRIEIKTGDELEEMADSFNNLYSSFEEVIHFTKAIGEGDLSATLTSKGKDDVLGQSLISMRDNLVKAAEDERLRKIADEKQSWIERGLSLFVQELRQDYEDSGILYARIIKLVVNYIDANQGALYIINEEEGREKCFEMVACIAWDRLKMHKKTIMLEEGLLGACYFEKAPIELTEIPEDYIEIRSGLGGSKPRMLMLIPLIHNEEVVGVIEVASFKEFDTYVKTYLARISESFASSITSLRINARTNELLNISKLQAEEMKAQEEEMRQNIEELHATQEEMRRKASNADRYQSAINQNFITLTMAQDSTILEMNDKAKALFGNDSMSIVGQPLTSYLPTEERDALCSDLSNAMQNRRVSRKITIVGKNGEPARIQATLIPDSDQSNSIEFIAYTLN